MSPFHANTSASGFIFLLFGLPPILQCLQNENCRTWTPKTLLVLLTSNVGVFHSRREYLHFVAVALDTLEFWVETYTMGDGVRATRGPNTPLHWWMLLDDGRGAGSAERFVIQVCIDVE